jgi:hypothetical protein
MKINTDNIKRFFILLSYISYIFLTVINNTLKIHNPIIDYVFIAVIGLCLKIADSTQTIQNIINNVDLNKIDELHNIITRTESIISNSTIIPISDRSIITPEEEKDNKYKNEPFTYSDPEITHRDISLNSNYILRIKNNNII